MEHNEHRLTLRLPLHLRDKIDKAREQRIGKPSRTLIILECIQKALSDIEVAAPPVRKSKAKTAQFSPHELNKLERGEWMGSFPYGYHVTKNTNRNRYAQAGQVTIHPTDSHIVRSIFEDYASGRFSVKDLHQHVLETYGVNKASSNLHHILKSKFYVGVMVWRGKEFPHKYPTFISQDLFDRAQLVRVNNNKYSLFAEQNPSAWKKDDRSTRVENQDPFLELFKKPIAFDDLLIKSKLSTEQLREKLLDYELNGLIEEVGPSRWTLKV